jgi:hypothetical protein
MAVVVLTSLALLWAQVALANVGVVLKKSFIDKYANRATISADYAVASVTTMRSPPKKMATSIALGRHRTSAWRVSRRSSMPRRSPMPSSA